MQRGSDRLSVHRDDEMKAELRGLLTSGHHSRTEEWHDPEPSAEDDPEVSYGPVDPGRPPGSVESLRYGLARLLGRTSFPAKPDRLRDMLRERHAPEGFVDMLGTLPDRTTYANAHELAEALVDARERA